MIMATRHMVVDQGGKVRKVVEQKAEAIARKGEAVVEIAPRGEAWVEICHPNVEHTPTTYQIRRNRFRVTCVELITKHALDLNIILGILTRTKMAILLPLKMSP